MLTIPTGASLNLGEEQMRTVQESFIQAQNGTMLPVRARFTTFVNVHWTQSKIRSNMNLSSKDKPLIKEIFVCKYNKVEISVN